jgi:hypothetical protein
LAPAAMRLRGALCSGYEGFAIVGMTAFFIGVVRGTLTGTLCGNFNIRTPIKNLQSLFLRELRRGLRRNSECESGRAMSPITRSRAFIVENKTTPGFSVEKIENKIALKVVQNGHITLKDVRVPEANRLQGGNSFRDTAKVLK